MVENTAPKCSCGAERDPLVLTIDDAAELLSVSKRTLWNLMSRGVIPYVHLGKRRLIPYAELRQVIDDLTTRAAS